MAVEQLIPLFVSVTLVILVVCMVMRMFKQPYVVAYILSGMLLSLMGIVKDVNKLSVMGEIGIILLMFFIGLEISLPKVISKWKVAVLGTIFQIFFSVGVMYLLGHFLGWSWERAVFIGFIISLSSTAVIIKILEDQKELHTKVGQGILGILIVQDLAVVPMMIILSTMAGESIDFISLLIKLLGALVLGVILYFAVYKRMRLPLPKRLIENHELQVFAALIICFGMAALTSFFGLSAALGAFFAGMLVSSYRGVKWAHNSLHSFKVVFVAMFFVYIGMLMDIGFLIQHWKNILLIVLIVFVINTAINTITLKLLGSKFRESLYAGSLLAQIGEFSFLIGAVGLSTGLILEFEYNLILSVISLTLLLSPLWIMFVRKIMHIDAHYFFDEMSKQLELTTTLEPREKKRIRKTSTRTRA
jgi:CPA2 family monovalent cation:H+ antiporter-2